VAKGILAPGARKLIANKQTNKQATQPNEQTLAPTHNHYAYCKKPDPGLIKVSPARRLVLLLHFSEIQFICVIFI